MRRGEAHGTGCAFACNKESIMRIENDLGYIELSRKAIADIAADTAMQCYGLVGMAHQRGRDGLIEILTRERLSKGVGVSFDGDGKLLIDLYVIVEQTIKVSVVADNIISAVKYNVERQTGLKVKRVTVNVVSVRA
ncbi:hypothetical protein HMP0721_2083 [Pseudoramibacter alactolyticus ATCC 23263]|uniref:Asp23/Gls24 family envelope stress response protein n=2 Tax=Pseudoramibacter TaxID=113286 RepID=E6MJ98_9FIRM|nr:hypothetical protein HMP0721_2083 [Pseudoramibacter alactolyticus ATCC 23263]